MSDNEGQQKINEPLTIRVVRDGAQFRATVGDLSQPGSTPDDAIGRVMRMTAWRFERLGVSLDLEPGMYSEHCNHCGGTGRIKES